MGGPPLVTPSRVKVGGSDRNEVRETWLPEIAPRPVGILLDRSDYKIYHGYTILIFCEPLSEKENT